jgi:hypothetical protein
MSTNNHGYIFTKNQTTRKILQVWCDHLSGIGRKYWILRNKKLEYVIFAAGELVRSTNHYTIVYQSIPLDDMLRDGWSVVEEH